MRDARLEPATFSSGGQEIPCTEMYTIEKK